jgi:hypothetical protein
MPADFEAYFKSLASTTLDDKTEHTDRGALETLLQALVDDAEPGARVIHEPRRDKGGAGSPDFKIVRQGRIAGYVEVKPIDENLSKVLKSDQIKKYKTLSDNIVLTDYLEFCWIKPGGEVIRQRLANSDDLSARRLRLRPEAVEAVRLLMRGFASATPEPISRSRDLALALASRAAMLRDFLTVELIRQAKEHQEGRLHALFQVFRDQVFHDLTTAEFADAFAQMLAYGLFLARLNAGANENITLRNVRQHIPSSFTLIRELVRFLEEMNEPEYADIRWVIDEVLSIVNGLNLAAIHTDLSFRSRRAISRKVRAGDEEEHRLFERDPFIYFYEDFLRAYDPASYRDRYGELLRRDFPRIPLPDDAGEFESLSILGWDLAHAHLLRELPRIGLAAYHGKGDHTVEAVRYSPNEQAIWINKTQNFAPVPQAVWHFHIGGYQVLEKYLKSRKGRVLTLDEINHVGAVADSLAFTIEQMKKIDEAYLEAFPAHV